MRRRTRFLLAAHALTAAGHIVPSIALAMVLPAPAAVAAGASLWAAVAWRLTRLAHDSKKPRWITACVDAPTFVHWGACLIATALSPLVGLTALVLGSSLPAACALSYGLGLLVALWSFGPGRRWVRVRRREVAIAGLPPAFDGYTIVQLSDLHVGSFDPKERGRAWVEMANGQGADLAVVTGDLVTSGTSFYEDVAEALSHLRAPDGVFVSMGNHDQWDNATLTRLIEAQGLCVLKNDWRLIERDGAALVLAGLDDFYTSCDDLPGSLAGRPDGAPTILLSHYPHFFSEGCSHGVDLMLSGHTHGGQIGLPGFSRLINVARLTGQHSAGLYRQGAHSLIVSAGLGTTGPPLRLGVAPEITVTVLRQELGASAAVQA